MKKRDRGFTLLELLVVIAIIGVLAAISIPNLLNAIQRGKQKRTMGDMRALATAIEAYQVDNQEYPVAACPAEVFTTIGSSLVSDSFSVLTPTYLLELPRQDGWRRFYLYALDSGRVSYNLRSLGSNGTTDATICGSTTSFNDDLIYSNGTFIQYPQGPQQ